MSIPQEIKPEIGVCAECGLEFYLRRGRGRKSPYCDSCKRLNRSRKSQQRALRHSLAQLYEWVEVLAPDIIARKEVLSEEQSHRCWDCGRLAKLYFARHENQLIGVCLRCQERRRTRS